MPFWPRLSSIFRNLLERRDVERDLDAELEAYVQLLADEKKQNGLRPDEALRQARAEVGSRESVKQSVRERRFGYGVETFIRDLQQGARMLWRSPGFTLLATMTLALGIAASTAVYSVVHGVLLERLPFPEPERLVFVDATARDGRQYFSPPDYVDLREASRAFEEIAAIHGQGLVTISFNGAALPVRAREVTADILKVYGVAPHLGRGFAPGDEDVVAFEDTGLPDATLPPSVILISHRFWEEHFGGDPAAIGKLVEVDYQPYQIIGVAPPGFATMIPGEGDYRLKVDIWLLSRMDFPRMPRDASFLRVVARLKPGVTLARARAEAEVFAARQRSRHRVHRESDYQVEVIPYRERLTGHHAASIWMLFGAVGLLLIIACANLANLLLTRSLARQKEFALRIALGSGRVRLVRQLVTENLLYGLLGVVVGLPLAHGLIEAFVRLAPRSVPRIEDISINASVLVFVLLISILCTMLVSLFPAARLSRRREQTALQAAGRAMVGTDRTPWGRVFVIAEISMSVVLVIGTGLLLTSLFALLDIAPGFRSERVLTSEMNLPSRRYPRYPRADERVRFVRRMTESIVDLPGVESAAFALVVPLSRQDAGHSYGTDEMVASNPVLPSAKYRPVTPGYFETIGTNLRAGRDFTWSDVEQYRLVSIVDETLARKAWPGDDPLGKRLRIETWSTAGGGIHLEPLWTEVIGVAENVRSGGLGREDPETVYLPYGLYAVSELALLARTASEPSALAEPVRKAFAQYDPDLAVFNFRALDDLIADSLAPERFSLNLVSAFGATGLLLALIGVYGVLSHSVSLRRREIGIRMALGASGGAVRSQELWRGAGLIALGIALGMLGASGLTRFVSSQLYAVSPIDWRVFSAVATLTLLVSLAACYVPAYRASKIDPIRALRTD